MVNFVNELPVTTILGKGLLLAYPHLIEEEASKPKQWEICLRLQWVCAKAQTRSQDSDVKSQSVVIVSWAGP
jgi:hypothetical protein